MTRRERLERKIEKRREWADKAAARADSLFTAAHKTLEHIPLGQPILVGHHSERRHRSDIAKADSRMSRAVEQSKLADHHTSKAGGLADQLDRTIFSDDPDAIEALEAKAAALRDEIEMMKAANKAHKAANGAPGWAKGFPDAEKMEAACARLFAICPYEKRPFPPYKLTNTSAEARRAEKRIEIVKARQARTEKAESAPGGVLIEGADYVRVTFAEKPARATLDAMKAAGFYWSGGSWCGYRAKLPADIAA